MVRQNGKSGLRTKSAGKSVVSINMVNDTLGNCDGSGEWFKYGVIHYHGRCVIKSYSTTIILQVISDAWIPDISPLRIPYTTFLTFYFTFSENPVIRHLSHACWTIRIEPITLYLKLFRIQYENGRAIVYKRFSVWCRFIAYEENWKKVIWNGKKKKRKGTKCKERM